MLGASSLNPISSCSAIITRLIASRLCPLLVDGPGALSGSTEGRAAGSGLKNCRHRRWCRYDSRLRARALLITRRSATSSSYHFLETQSQEAFQALQVGCGVDIAGETEIRGADLERLESFLR